MTDARGRAAHAWSKDEIARARKRGDSIGFGKRNTVLKHVKDIHIATNYELRTTNSAFQLFSKLLVYLELVDLKIKMQNRLSPGSEER